VGRLIPTRRRSPRQWTRKGGEGDGMFR
jgi:hypothetical protein